MKHEKGFCAREAGVIDTALFIKEVWMFFLMSFVKLLISKNNVLQRLGSRIVRKKIVMKTC